MKDFKLLVAQYSEANLSGLGFGWRVRLALNDTKLTFGDVNLNALLGQRLKQEIIKLTFQQAP